MQVVDVRRDDVGEASGDPGDAKLATLADKKEAPIVEIDILGDPDREVRPGVPKGPNYPLMMVTGQCACVARC